MSAVREMVGEWAPQAAQVAADYIGMPREDWDSLEVAELLTASLGMVCDLTAALAASNAACRAFEHSALTREIARRSHGAVIMVGRPSGTGWTQVGHDDSRAHAEYLRDQLLAGGVACAVVAPREGRFIPSLYRSWEEWQALVSARYAEQLAQYQRSEFGRSEAAQ